MIIEIRNADIFTEMGSEYNIFAHGANCCNTMGAGIAAEVAKRFPQMYEVDRQAAKRGLNVTGMYSVAPLDQGVWGVNLYTQLMPGATARLSYIEDSIYLLANAAADLLGDVEPIIAIPKIGCGIGGLRWESVEAVVNRASGDVKVIVYDFDPRKAR